MKKNTRLARAIALVLMATLLMSVSAFASGETSGEASSEELSDKLISTVVETDKGTIEGFATEGTYGSTVYSYYGIPYTAAPVGELRWTAAQDAYVYH